MRGILKLRWDERAADDALVPMLRELAEAALAAAEALAAVAEVGARLPEAAAACRRRWPVLAQRFEREAADGHVRWIDLSPQQARLVESPLDIREMLGEQRAAGAEGLDLHLGHAGRRRQARLVHRQHGPGRRDHVARGQPLRLRGQRAAVGAGAFPEAQRSRATRPPWAALAARLAGALGGRTFVLTTTLRVLPQIAEALRAEAEGAGHSLDVLVQGTQPRRALLQRFGDGRGCVLVGSQSFWEGIDMPGDALQCVLIDKLPFPPPNDPLVEARVKQLKAQGRDAFDDYFVAEAAVSLKQGAGRLIRTETDRGLLVVCDPRMRQMGYGRRLRAALPPMGWLDDEAEALDWLRELAAAHGW